MVIPYGSVIGSFLPDLPDFEFRVQENVRVRIDLYMYPDAGSFRHTVYDEVLAPVDGTVSVVDTPSLILPFLDFAPESEYMFTNGMVLQVDVGEEAMYAIVKVTYASASVVPPSLFKKGETAPADGSYDTFVSGRLLSQCAERSILPDGHASLYYVPNGNRETFTIEALIDGRRYTASVVESVPMDGNIHAIDVSPQSILAAVREQNSLSHMYTADYLSSYRVSAAHKIDYVIFRVLHDADTVTARFLYRGLFGMLEEMPVTGISVRKSEYEKETSTVRRRLVNVRSETSVHYEVSTSIVSGGVADGMRSLFRSPAVWLRSADPNMDMQEAIIYDVTCEESDAPDRLLSYKFKYRLCDTAEKAFGL